ncbi:hypothetical protein, partial [Rubricoccus marinus]
LPLSVEGPFGYSLAPEAPLPRFDTTGFVITPPLRVLEDSQHEQETNNVIDPAWWFARVRFRRRILRAGRAHSEEEDDLDSLPTKPIWTQFLPPSSHFRYTTGGTSGAIPVRDLRVTSHSPGQWKVCRGRDEPALPLTPSAKPDRMHLWVLITEALTDAYGRRSQEAYLDLQPLEKGKFSTEKAFDRVSEYRVRIVEIHSTPPQEGTAPEPIESLSGPSLMEALFPDADAGVEARARIVRLSGYIPVTHS